MPQLILILDRHLLDSISKLSNDLSIAAFKKHGHITCSVALSQSPTSMTQEMLPGVCLSRRSGFVVGEAYLCESSVSNILSFPV